MKHHRKWIDFIKNIDKIDACDLAVEYFQIKLSIAFTWENMSSRPHLDSSKFSSLSHSSEASLQVGGRHSSGSEPAYIPVFLGLLFSNVLVTLVTLMMSSSERLAVAARSSSHWVKSSALSTTAATSLPSFLVKCCKWQVIISAIFVILSLTLRVFWVVWCGGAEPTMPGQ